nr:MAG TPA: hypothetical protein [Caudoviricetes sp.]
MSTTSVEFSLCTAKLFIYSLNTSSIISQISCDNFYRP